ncbi:hypothetical protein HII31_00301 [Pseudocercospora fuligena]|uniref:Uncharacterized protein n=1 Tax=Pseudocercospora fuligena TaxID=685502 RepID=A0A8H6RX61_9PEZI|nr:hypothetical protein HII31_00301 [Pseudocercospora fuligena]
MNGAWHELACLVCKANTPSGSEKLFQNVGRLLAHVTNCHGQQPGKTREEKLEGCIQRTCDKEDLERLRNDKYEILYTSGDEPLRKSRPWAIEASDASGKSESKSEVSKEPNLEGSPALPSRIQGAQESTAPPNANEPVRKDSIGQVQRKCTHAQVLDSSSGIPNNTDSKMSSEGKQSTNFGSTTSSDNARRDSGGRSVTGKEMYEPNVFSTAGGSPGPDQATRDPRFQGRTLKPQQMLPRSRAELNLAAIAAFNSSAPHAPHAPSPTPDQAPAGQGRSQHINRQSTPKSTGASESLGFPARVVTSGLVSSPSQPLMKRHCGEDGGNDELRSLPARRLRIAPGRRPSLLLQAPVQANQALDEKR